MKFHKVVAGIGGLAIAGGIALGASVGLASGAQAAPSKPNPGTCAGEKAPPHCRIVTGSFQTVDTSTDITYQPTLGPSGNTKAKSWTDETTTTTTTTTDFDVVDVFHLGTGDFVKTETVQTDQEVTTETSTLKLNPGGDAPEGQQNK